MTSLAVLSHLEALGVAFDTNLMLTYHDTIVPTISALEARAHQSAGHPFLLSSPTQVATVLYTELNLTINTEIKATCGGRHKSTDADGDTSTYDL